MDRTFYEGWLIKSPPTKRIWRAVSFRKWKNVGFRKPERVCVCASAKEFSWKPQLKTKSKWKFWSNQIRNVHWLVKCAKKRESQLANGKLEAGREIPQSLSIDWLTKMIKKKRWIMEVAFFYNYAKPVLVPASVCVCGFVWRCCLWYNLIHY